MPWVKTPDRARGLWEGEAAQDSTTNQKVGGRKREHRDIAESGGRKEWICKAYCKAAPDSEGVRRAICDSEQNVGHLRWLLPKRHFSFLLLCNKLPRILCHKATPIVFLSFYRSEAQHSVAGVSAQVGSPGAAVRMLARLVFLWSWGPLPSSQTVGKKHFL